MAYSIWDAFNAYWDNSGGGGVEYGGTTYGGREITGDMTGGSGDGTSYPTENQTPAWLQGFYDHLISIGSGPVPEENPNLIGQSLTYLKEQEAQGAAPEWLENFMNFIVYGMYHRITGDLLPGGVYGPNEQYDDNQQDYIEAIFNYNYNHYGTSRADYFFTDAAGRDFWRVESPLGYVVFQSGRADSFYIENGRLYPYGGGGWFMHEDPNVWGDIPDDTGSTSPKMAYVVLPPPESKDGTASDDVISGKGWIRGLDGNDTLTGFLKRDLLEGGTGSDILRGSYGRDTLSGGTGGDTLNGGSGFDFASYEQAASGVTVHLANSALNTGEAAGDSFFDVEGVIGSDHADNLSGNANSNYLEGGKGDDVLKGGAGADTLDGGKGQDFADYSDAASAVYVDLSKSSDNMGGDAVGDVYKNIEGAIGSAHGDILIGDAGANHLKGQGGNDTLLGCGGADTLEGGSGFDTASYAHGTSGVLANLLWAGGNTGAAAGDSYVGIEALVGSAFDDILIGNAGENRLSGGAGNDLLAGSGGADFLEGGEGHDEAYYGDATSGVYVSLESPGLNGGPEASGDSFASIEGLKGSQHDDGLVGNEVANTLSGLNGDDALSGRAGADILDGGDGDDVLNGGADSDILWGGAGADVFCFDAALSASGNVDMITDFSGEDRIALSQSVFSNLQAGGLAAGAFTVGAAATSAEHRIIHDLTTGALFYDADGNGGMAAVQFAKLSANLTAAHFLVTA